MKIDKSKIYKEIVIFLMNFGIKKVFVFGSYARNEEDENSDIDLIVEFEDQKSLLQYVEIENDLSERIGIKVDMLTENSINPYIYSQIKEEMVGLY